MKTKTLYGALTVLALAISGCEKQQPATTTPQTNVRLQTSPSENSRRTVQQTMFELTPEQSLAEIKRFKESCAKHSNQPKAKAEGLDIDEDTLPVESSIYVIEAALNFDYDRKNVDDGNEVYEMEIRTVEFSIPLQDGDIVNTADLEDLYETFKTNFDNEVTSGYLIHGIDIEATIDETTSEVWYSAKVAALGSTKHNCAGWPNTSTGIAHPGNTGCTTNGIILVTSKLNCLAFAGCTSQGGYGYYFTNVGQTPQNSPDYNSNVTTSYYSAAQWVSPTLGCIDLNGTELNNLRSYYQNLVSGAGIPSGYALVFASIAALTSPHPSNPNIHRYDWHCYLFQGKRNCRTAPIE